MTDSKIDLRVKFKRLPIGGCYLVEGVKCFPYTVPALRVYQKVDAGKAVCVRQVGYPNTDTVGSTTIQKNRNALVLPCTIEGYVKAL